MNNYRNFKLVAYFIAQATATETREHLQSELDFFKRYMRLDKVYLEPFRSGVFASEEQVKLCREVLEQNGVEVCGGITTTTTTPEGDEPKQRMFDTFCYNDPKMLEQLRDVASFLGAHYDEFIIDDFYFTNCTCDACRKGRDEYNAAHGITDGSWQAYRMDLMKRVSEQYMIAPAKAQNPDCKIVIKYPNWAEGYQETGYNPAEQRKLFDGVYTGTETRDPVNTDQHLPRYLSFSLMTYFEAMCPEKNGGGWFDPYDLHSLDQYLEQAYLTAFGKPREIMLFCFQSLVDTCEAAALGYHLDRLDRALDFLGKPVGVPCYLPDNCQGEDNVQDFLGMCGLPIVLTPYFPEAAPTLMLTRSSACDPQIVDKLEAYVAKGGKAIVTTGFMGATQERGIRRMTSVRMAGRRVSVNDYMIERTDGDDSCRMLYAHGREDVTIPVAEFRNNATWALVKGVKGEENYAMLLRDTYGKGQLLTLAVPDAYGELKQLPSDVLTRIRAELPVNGVYLEAPSRISLFAYDNDAYVLYSYVEDGAQDALVRLHVQGKAKRVVVHPLEEKRIEPLNLIERAAEPLYTNAHETVFEATVKPGKYMVFSIER